MAYVRDHDRPWRCNTQNGKEIRRAKRLLGGVVDAIVDEVIAAEDDEDMIAGFERTPGPEVIDVPPLVQRFLHDSGAPGGAASRQCWELLNDWPIEWKWGDASLVVNTGLTLKLAERNQIRWDPPYGGSLDAVAEDILRQKDGERPVQVGLSRCGRVRSQPD